MLYPNRRFAVADIDTAEELAEKLTQMTWTKCTGFRFRAGEEELLFLNDSTSEDAAQEYAVIRRSYQVESITFSWCNQERAAELIREVLAGQTGCTIPINPRIDPNPNHVCHLCR